jgi:hypothetical protein
MTTADVAEDAILNRWIDQWGTTTPFVFAEEQLPSTIQRGETSWANVTIQDTETEQLTKAPVGLRKFLRRAAVQVIIYTPTNAGMRSALLLAEQARTVFEGIRLGAITFYAARLDRLGPVPPENLVLMTCPLEYVEIK